MNRPARKTPLAGGVILAASILTGAVIGASRGQPSAGLVIGIVVGALVALLVWWRDGKRGG